MPTCSFCKKNYEFPRGLTVFTFDGRSVYFCSSKCKRNSDLKRDPKKVNWIKRKRKEGKKIKKVKEKNKEKEETKTPQASPIESKIISDTEKDKKEKKSEVVEEEEDDDDEDD